MSIRHHPAPATLLAYAAGSLDRAATAVLATHVSLCRSCRADAALLEAAGGAMLADLPAAPMAEDALERALARLASPGEASPPPIRMLAEGVPLPPALDGLVAGRWRWLAPGVRRIGLLKRGPEHGQLYLLRVDPGVRVPQHGHEAWEATCVLAGAFQDKLGRFGPGDLVEVDAEHRHAPVAGGIAPCICLVAAVGRMRFESRVARLLQPLVGV